MEIKCYTLEARYNDGGGGRCDVVMAPDFETAKRIAALNIITDNGWDDTSYGPSFAAQFKSLSDFYQSEMELLHSWEGLDGTACPSCTSHDGKKLAARVGDGVLHRCGTCGYKWVPLGRVMGPDAINRHMQDVSFLDEWEANNMKDKE